MRNLLMAFAAGVLCNGCHCFSNSLSAFFNVFFVYRILFCSTALYGGGYVETAPLQYLFQRPDGACGLPEKPVERIWSRACSYQYGFLALEQRMRQTSAAFAHHAVYYSVEQYLECSRHVTPITWRPDHEHIAFAYGFQRCLRVVFRQNASVSGTAGHAALAGRYSHVVDADRMCVCACGGGCIRDCIQHARQIAVFAGTPVYD